MGAGPTGVELALKFHLEGARLTLFEKEGITEKDLEKHKAGLETQFYNIFRTIVRIYLNKFEYRQIRKEILLTIDDLHYSYRGKLKNIEKELRKLLETKVDFKDIDEKDLLDIERVVLCSDGESCSDEKDLPTYCLISDDGNCVSPDGCIDSTACNYDSSAVCDDGSCTYFTCTDLILTMNDSYGDGWSGNTFDVPPLKKLELQLGLGEILYRSYLIKRLAIQLKP